MQIRVGRKVVVIQGLLLLLFRLDHYYKQDIISRARSLETACLIKHSEIVEKIIIQRRTEHEGPKEQTLKMNHGNTH